jgi:predicted MFS family arabinose efflux permease
MTTQEATPKGANRNIGLLAATQATLGAQQALVMTVGALVGVLLAPNPAFATVPATAMIVGLALAAGPSAFLVHRLGRKRAFIGGGLLTIVACLLAALALFVSSFILFSIATGLIGVSAALSQQYRFAAADSVPPGLKGRAISLVLLGGVLTGVVGPALATYGRTWIEGAEYAGSFLGMAGLSLLAIGILSLTSLPKAEKKQNDVVSQSVSQLIRSRDVFVPVITGMASYGLMTLVMIATPLAMVVVCGHSKEAASTAIQWHIIAMFLPSFVTGHIISRIGARTTTGLGLTLILACALVALNGRSVMHFDIALILLGVGWNFGFIGSTAMLASGYRQEDAARVQAINEQLVFGAMAIASIGSGLLLQLVGWDAVLVITLPLATGAIALLAWREWAGSKTSAAE